MTYAFMNGEFLPLAEAKVGVMTHALHYGTSVFEGIRGNWNPEQEKLYVFRLKEHYERFLQGCKIMRIKVPHTAEELSSITLDLLGRSGYQQDIYIRPLAFKGEERVAILKLQDLSDSLVIFPIPLGAYLDLDAAARCCTSSWRRMEDTMIPPRNKIGGLYVNSILAKTEATLAGFDEAILLTNEGYVSEGAGENIFMVMNGKLITPSVSDNILAGITRDAVIRIAKNELGLETMERSMRRSELYNADECFLTGTAAHLTPVGSIDNIEIGDGEIGQITKELQRLYFDVIRGRIPKYLHWCTLASTTAAKASR
ncbi:MAG: branched-chain amino acid transaminase [Chloroflexi bacterium]|nr:branched-chain amino acid transaminase [Chloroflexota bacterium]